MTATPRQVTLVGLVSRVSSCPPDPPDPPDRAYPAFLDFDRLPHDSRERPSLAPAQRPRLDDGDDIAGLRLVLLVVHHELRGPPLGFSVQPVAHLPLHGNDDALLHLVADDDAGLLTLLRHFLPTFS